VRMKSLIPAVLVLAACGGKVSEDQLSADAFVGTWLCGHDPPLTITANGSGLTETLTGSTPEGPLTCTMVFSITGSTATLIPSQTTCTGPACMTVRCAASSVTETVSGNTMTLTGTDPGSAPRGFLCTRQ